PLVSPFDGVVSSRVFRAEIKGVRPPPHAPQVESVRIPARQDSNIPLGQPQFVVSDGLVKEREVLLAQVDQNAPQGRRKIGGALAVSGVAAVILPAAVVQVGEELDDQPLGPGKLRDAQAVLAHSLPVRHAMDAVQVEGESLLGGADHLLEISLAGAKCGHRFSTVCFTTKQNVAYRRYHIMDWFEPARYFAARYDAARYFASGPA